MASATVVLPGDKIDYQSNPDEEKASSIRIGPGLVQDRDDVIAIKAGVLKSSSNGKWWIESSQKRYIPSAGENVLGIITARNVEGYRVDIGAAHPAQLSAFAFEGATKKNRPTLEVGALVYARISVANKDMEPELECISPNSGKADGYGEVKDGFSFNCSLALARNLLKAENAVLSALGERIPFEIAVGMNGRVWVNAGSSRHIVLVVNAIKNSEHVSPEKAKDLVRALTKQLEDSMDISQ
ncbi:uncharacterized protein BJ171DRAFT_443542 [Polychytrium aggregatum]|uniref:uncharacterized protein n=1 Tax=Polychytrium aggregatum TaxID=110093 RepID=UPI0022FE20D3|nr:uncharacterized protein BJ171DRAFT_443542 [Polychytrium aggregatum]KAI9203301.1 hypothetical protein BJ171DRAFT_443542 [Polychytrium aggregatum]